MRAKYGMIATCKYCGQDIQFFGKSASWRDRGNNRQCTPYVDSKTQEVTAPKTKHRP